jgi:hypothetical protein
VRGLNSFWRGRVAELAVASGLALAFGATSCAQLTGIDFDGRLPSETADARTADALIADVSSTDATTNEPDVNTTDFDPRWTRWAVSGSFPSDQTTAQENSVLDRKTGLMWQQSATEIVTWENAMGVCSSLRLRGFSDWRVPTRIELLSLVNYYFSAATSADIMPRVADTWTASSFAGDPTRAWYVNFGSGATLDKEKNVAQHIRCVRAGNVTSNTANVRFVLSFGTVYDRQTQLTWQADETFNGTFTQATAHCQRLTINGVGGFRLPTIHELLSIVDETQTNPALASGTFSTKGLTWSDTKRAGATDTYWTIDDYDGHILTYGTSGTANVRCVK